jgi:hypothetical protein
MEETTNGAGLTAKTENNDPKATPNNIPAAGNGLRLAIAAMPYKKNFAATTIRHHD